VERRCLSLQRERWEVRIIDVDGQKLEIVLPRDIEKRVAGDVVVNVHVKLGDAHELGFGVAAGDGRTTGTGRRRGDTGEQSKKRPGLHSFSLNTHIERYLHP